MFKSNHALTQGHSREGYEKKNRNFKKMMKQMFNFNFIITAEFRSFSISLVFIINYYKINK